MKKAHYLVCVLLWAGASNTAVASWAMALSSAGSLDGQPSPPSAPSPASAVSASPVASEPRGRAHAPSPDTAPAALPISPAAEGAAGGYVARNDNLRVFFDALSSHLGRPVIVSNMAARKQVSGNFDMTNARALLESMATRLGLIWYHDGQSIYVYDASEIRNATVSLTHTNLSDLVSYLRGAGLYDRRYPIRGESGSKVFYVSGPPVFVDLVLAASRSIDRSVVNDVPAAGPDQIGVVRMEHGFVSDRTYQMRDEKIVIPGMESVIKQLVQTTGGGGSSTLPPSTSSTPSTQLPLSPQDRRGVPAPVLPPPPGGTDTPAPPSALGAAPPLLSPTRAGGIGEPGRGQLVVQAFPAGNSLLVRGTAEQVERVERLVSRLDAPRRHIELSLWIIDVRKEALDALGVDWSGGVNIGSRVGVLLNAAAPVSTLDGVRFLAKIQAMASNGLATVVSRPVILTQENIPALFDGSQTFYVPLEGERTTDLRSVTYGTMISVWPRFAGRDEIEMTLNIEDGTSAPSKESDGQSKYTVLPTVSRTRISTIARVPQGKSLLIGGYTRDSGDSVEKKIPLLGDIPWLGRAFRYTSTSQNNDVRVFLIQPREIDGPLQRDASDIAGDTVATLPYPVGGVSKDVRGMTGLEAPASSEVPKPPIAPIAPIAPVTPGAAPQQPSTGVRADQGVPGESLILHTGADRGQS